MELINTIRVERAKLDITQKTLAKALSLCVNTIGNIEDGRTNPKITTAFKIASYFSLKVDDLFSLKEEVKNEEN